MPVSIARSIYCISLYLERNGHCSSSVREFAQSSAALKCNSDDAEEDYDDLQRSCLDNLQQFCASVFVTTTSGKNTYSTTALAAAAQVPLTNIP